MTRNSFIVTKAISTRRDINLQIYIMNKVKKKKQTTDIVLTLGPWNSTIKLISISSRIQ